MKVIGSNPDDLLKSFLLYWEVIPRNGTFTRLKGLDLYNCDDFILGKEGLKALLIDNFSRVPFSRGIRRENFVFANRTNHHSMCTTLQVFPCHIGTTQCIVQVLYTAAFLCSFLFNSYSGVWATQGHFIILLFSIQSSEQLWVLGLTFFFLNLKSNIFPVEICKPHFPHYSMAALIFPCC